MKQVVLWAFAGFFLCGQTALAQFPDTLLAKLTLNRFLGEVAAYHPAAANARILSDQAAAVLTSARGAFDPKLYADWEQKSFDGKNYFTVGSSGLKVQTPYAISLKSEFNVARGQFLNPENKLPSEGQAVVGVSLPVLNGLMIDSERAGLQQARLGVLSGEAQQRLQMNDLLFQAGLAYVDWAIAFNQVEIFRKAADIAKLRLEIMVESFRQGDKPAVDTLETFILWQNRLFDLNESALELANAAQTLETFFWTPGQAFQGRGILSGKQPVLLPDSSEALPPAPEDFLTGLADRHPALRQLQLDLQALDIDRRLAAEQFKPRLDVSYHFLAAGTDFLSPVNGGGGAFLRDLLTENYKWGLNFSFPLLLRKEQGKMQQVRLKQQMTSNKLEQKQAELEAKIGNYYNELQTTDRQVALYEQIAQNYNRLLEAEQIKFNLGESSVFLLNTREQKLIEAQIKLAKLRGLFQKNRLALSWAAGQLPNQVQ